ncbi:acyltransferase [Natronospirillum operosum]|uniref:Acyltransferase n=1 Tax=Natronospirillum operosum TaxID=2759953 RepID=A0A4Z0WAC8_9GAMM|nr:acyltransferase [Natronospirillum operosum]TGG95102.1 acyltransferase [Natronospirillum operosum]
MKSLFTGLMTGTLMLSFTILGIIPMMIIALCKLVIPLSAFRRFCSLAVMWIAETWAEANKQMFNRLTSIHWHITDPSQLSRNQSYLLVCNHQSWVDIPALVQTFNRRLPFYKFFLKQQLIWVPLLGLAFWALEFPFMKRYSQATLKKKPHLRGKDLQATQQACERYRDMPVTLINFPEGTRFTPAKHARQQSPYRHLLRPKAGGIAFVLQSMGNQIDHILDVTIHYPDGKPTFLKLLCGQIRQVNIEVKQLPVEPAWRQGDYQNNEAYRQAFQQWVSELWARKDARLEALQH